jgi:hypothetical protein
MNISKEISQENPFNLLAINKPMCDWMTFTSWRMDGFGQFVDTCWMPDDARDETRLNYTGKRYATMFLGDGVQNGHWHKMLQVSGAAADEVLPLVLDFEDNWECTQLDLQITCDWVNAPLFELCKELIRIHGEKKVQYLPSATGATVYKNSWSSEKLFRVYHKSNKLVRFEVKFKKAYASGMARKMVNLPETERREYIRSWLRWELSSLNSPMLEMYFGSALGSNSTKTIREVAREESDRERWIRKVVLPCLEKYSKSHDCDRGLLETIERVVQWRENGDNNI